ncbi:MAG: hypothetical protein QM803_18645 [Rhodocyclaceae bacterium]
MLNRHTQRGQVLIAIFVTTLLIGGSISVMSSDALGGRAISALRKDVPHIVQDETRRKQIDDVLDDMEKTQKKIGDKHADNAKRWLALLAAHDSARQQFEDLAATVEVENRQQRDDFVALRFRLRDLVSADEWRQLFPPPQAPDPVARQP